MPSVTPQVAQVPARTYPTVPYPTREPASLQASVERLKEGYELLTGQTGPKEYSMQEGLTQIRRQLFTADQTVTARMLELNEAQTSANNALAQRTTIIEAEITNARGGEASLLARITTVDQARISGDNALASRTTTLETNVGTNTANITSLQSSVNGLNVKFGVYGTINGTSGGFTFSGVQRLDGAVSYGMEFEVNTFKIKDVNTSTAKTVFAYNDGKFEFTGDVAIQGNLIVSGTVNTPQITDLAVSTPKVANNAITTLAHARSAEDIKTVSVDVTVRQNAILLLIADASGTTTSQASPVPTFGSLHLQQGGVDLRIVPSVWARDGGGSFYFLPHSSFHKVGPLNAGTITFTTTSTNTFVYSGSVGITVMELVK